MSRLLFFKTLFMNKLALISFCLVLIWSVSDYQSRFILQSNRINNQFSDIKAEKIHNLKLSEEQSNQIIQLYQGYVSTDKPKTVAKSAEPKPKSGLTTEEQLKQQGLLKQVYINDEKLELKAIVTQQLKGNKTLMKALLLVTNIKNGSVKVEPFEQNSVVYGYHLNIDSNTQITLTRDQQTMVMAMYASH